MEGYCQIVDQGSFACLSITISLSIENYKQIDNEIKGFTVVNK